MSSRGEEYLVDELENGSLCILLESHEEQRINALLKEEQRNITML